MAKKRDLPTGVYRRPSGRYIVQLRIDDKFRNLGIFDTIEEASTRASAARRDYPLVRKPKRPLRDLGDGTYAVPLAATEHEAWIDAQDAPVVSLHNWYTYKGYVTARVEGRLVTMHRLILGLDDVKQSVDHVNGVRSDNRRSNLRLCTISQNTQNAKKRANCSSKYKGVTWLHMRGPLRVSKR